MKLYPTTSRLRYNRLTEAVYDAIAHVFYGWHHKADVDAVDLMERHMEIIMEDARAERLQSAIRAARYNEVFSESFDSIEEMNATANSRLARVLGCSGEKHALPEVR